jgi:hypothetical protein
MSNRVSEKEAVQVMRKAGLRPLVPYPGAGVNWKCKCLKCKNIVFPRLASIKRGGGCIGCAGLLKVSATDAKLILQKANIEPISEFPGYRKKWKSRCLTCKKIIYPAASSVKIRGKGCVYCGYESTASKRRFSEKEAISYMKEKGLTPLEKYKSVNVPWKCINGFSSYLISNQGQVFSRYKNKILKNAVDKDGYNFVRLYMDSKYNSKKIHRLVYEYFGENWNEELSVDHINRNKLDYSKKI